MQNTPTFLRTLQEAWTTKNSLLCVGLDPAKEKLPAQFKESPTGIYDFCKKIVDATAEHVCCFKPQIAYFAACRAEESLEALITYIHQAHPSIPVILDAKRGDIGSTAEQYAIEAFERYKADAVTINPYMGYDSVAPYLNYRDKGVILLCRTSNPGGSDLQFLNVNKGQKLYEHVAELVTQWDTHQQCALVVGATFPEEIAKVRHIIGNMPLLVPGIGAQGGDIQATVSAGQTADGYGLMINSSRAILYASTNDDFENAANDAARSTKEAINQFRHTP